MKFKLNLLLKYHTFNLLFYPSSTIARIDNL
jgi:hypothetical protein